MYNIGYAVRTNQQCFSHRHNEQTTIQNTANCTRVKTAAVEIETRARNPLTWNYYK